MYSEPASPYWVFAYGSLIWNPGFSYSQREPASLYGYHRALCIYSHVHRGTEQTPGLVLGLDQGGSCKGIVYQVAGEKAVETLSYLRAREQINQVYRELVVSVHLASGGSVKALTYVADRKHSQYCGRLPIDQIVKLVRQGHGQSGTNIDYVRNTQQHLQDLNIYDHTLEHLVREL